VDYSTRILFALAPNVDHSSFCASSFRTAYRLLHTRCSAFAVRLGLLLPGQLLPRVACRLLCIRHLTFRDGLRIAPYATTSRPRVVHGLLRAQHFKLRTEDRSLDLRRLAFCSDHGLLHSLRCAPRVAHRLLCAQHFRALHRLRSTPASTLIAPPRLPITRRTTLGFKFQLADIAARLCYHPCLACGSLRTQHLVLRAGTFRKT